MAKSICNNKTGKKLKNDHPGKLPEQTRNNVNNPKIMVKSSPADNINITGKQILGNFNFFNK